jgi:GntR family transcriptional regulator/MocR family aminotransferase
MRRASAAVHTPLIPFDPTSDVPYYTQIYNGYRNAILSGQLCPGQRVPTTRSLSAELEISRFPVLAAFRQLLQDGYLVAKVGSGTFVGDPVPDELTKPIVGRKLPPRAFPHSFQIPSVERDEPGPDSGSGLFTVGLPALDHFPHHVFSRLLCHHARVCAEHDLAYGDPAGHPPLRRAIADFLRTTRAVDCDPEQVLIVAGSQMALVMCAIALSTSDSNICVEEPGYSGAARAFTTAGANVIHVAVDDEGIDVSAVRRLSDPVRAVYLTPSHQYPLGGRLEMTRRMELLSWAAGRGAWIVEDDYDNEYTYSARPLGAVQGMDTNGRVIYVGTFSKAMFPALRLGYMVVPRLMLSEFLRIRDTIDICPPILNQLALADFIRQGHFARHLRRMRILYRARRDALTAAIDEHAADVLAVGNHNGGMHLVALLPAGVDDLEVVRRAAEHRLFPSALSTCYATTSAPTGLILGYGGSDERALAGGVTILAEIIRGLA